MTRRRKTVRCGKCGAGEHSSWACPPDAGAAAVAGAVLVVVVDGMAFVMWPEVRRVRPDEAASLMTRVEETDEDREPHHAEANLLSGLWGKWIRIDPRRT